MYKLGNYIPGKSPVHGLDPRVKILSVISLSLVLLQAGPAGAFLVSVLLASLIPAARISPVRLWEALTPVRVFLLLLLLLHTVGTGGEPLPPFPVWKINVTREGLFTGFIVAWRFGLLVTAAAFMTMTTSPSELVAGLERLMKPLARFGVPVTDLTTMVSLALRFVPTLLEEVDRMKEARLARGASLTAGKIRSRIRTALSVVVPVVVSSSKRAEELAAAMEARAYGFGPRTFAKEMSLGASDLTALMTVGIVSVAAVFL